MKRARALHRRRPVRRRRDRVGLRRLGLGLPVRRGRRRTVLVLERGRPDPAGAPSRAAPGTCERRSGTPSGNLYGMFNIWHFQDIEAVVSSGLGGGSLIYANVLLRKDEHWFTQDVPGGSWPGAVGRHPVRPRSLLRLRPERTLRAQTLPFGVNGYQLRKTAGLATPRPSSARTGASCRLAVRFHNDHQPPVPGEQLVEEAVRQHLRASSAHVPALWRVRHRLQRRCQEHPRPHLPVEGVPRPGTAPQPAERGEGARRDGDHFVVHARSATRSST